MQPNQLSLPVDYLNDGTTTPETYDRFEEYQNRSVYIGASHAPESRDTITLYRSFPKKSGNFNGVAKTAVKFSKDIGVLGVDGLATLTAPVIVEVNFSVPVGTSQADILKARQRAIALLDDDSVMVPLNSQMMV